MKKNTTSKTDTSAFIDEQDLKIEQIVIGTMLMGKTALTIGLDLLVSDAFMIDKHKEIFRAVTHLNEIGGAADIMTVSDQLRKMGKLQEVGGPGYVASLTNHVASDAHFENHCLIVKEKYIAREQMIFGEELFRIATDPTSDVFETNEYMIDEVNRIHHLGEGTTIHSAEDLVKQMIKDIEEAKKKEGVTGTPTGFKSIDKVFGGWQPGNMIVLAARPGMGKTALMICFAYLQVVLLKKTVMIFSLEMSAIEIFKRFASIMTEIDASKFKTGELSDDDWTQFHHKIGPLITDRLIIVDDCTTMQEIKNRVKKERMSRDIHAVYIDYLQLIEGRGKTREQEISYCSRQSKLLAKEAQTPVIALSQLSRDVEKRTDKRPVLSDLRESGAIEQDADIVTFLYRPRYYDKDNDDPYSYFIIAKHRNGRLKDVKLSYIHARTQFIEPNNDKPF